MMEQSEVDKVMKQIDHVYSCPGNELMKAYDEWAKDYDEDLQTVKYSSPYQTAETLMKHIRPNAKVIDIACGTGLVGESMRKLGFAGILHGLDGSQEMLKLAKEKGNYNEVFAQYLIPGEPMKSPNGIKYDGLICVGAFTKNHLDPHLVEDFLSVLSPGAVMAIAIRQTSFNEGMLNALLDIFEKLEGAGEVVKLELAAVPGAIRADEVKSSALQTSGIGDFSEKIDIRILCYRKN